MSHTRQILPLYFLFLLLFFLRGLSYRRAAIQWYLKLYFITKRWWFNCTWLFTNLVINYSKQYVNIRLTQAFNFSLFCFKNFDRRWISNRLVMGIRCCAVLILCQSNIGELAIFYFNYYCPFSFCVFVITISFLVCLNSLFII